MLHIVIVIFILLLLLVCIGIISHVLKSSERFIQPTALTTFFYKDTIFVNTKDPFFQYNAKQKLIDNFSLKTSAHVDICLSKDCSQYYTLPSNDVVAGVLDDTSLFRFMGPVVEETITKPTPVTEYFTEFGVVNLTVSCTTNVPLHKLTTLANLKTHIQNGAVKVWFDESQYLRDTFTLHDGRNQYLTWSPDKTIPDCPDCDTLRIVPRK